MTLQSFRGGAKIGWVNASWPFGKLSVEARQLTLTCLGSYTFKPEDVVTIEPHGSIPVLARGIRIGHNRMDYPETMIFWCLGSREKVLDGIRRNGFEPQGETAKRPPGFAVKWRVLVAAVVLWNVLFLSGPSPFEFKPPQPGPSAGALLALLLAFAAATATRSSPWVQQVVLRDGHQVGEIKHFLVLLQLITGFLSLVFGLLLLTG
ncbi:hypothetical protein LRH25_02790 [Ideonella azotifigens]|uniref:Uncharacterized protein n=1 Tax=Ideonella azotifigens TaxID=513160 RepID=A0ABP3VYQ8_9BURK|nr:hypothetical protein [Ideonella azotifigens]MCD2339262.1 hypothetical protein [Ideonella azotifigens]